MKKIILFAVALMVAAGSLFAADLQNAVSRAIVEAQANQVYVNPLGLTPTTFDGQNYLLVLSNHINNFYVPENIQNNYVDKTSLTVAVYFKELYPKIEGDDIEYADERNPDDVLRAFTRSYNGKIEAYYVIRVVHEKRNRYVHHIFAIHRGLNQNEMDFKNIVKEHHVEWINAVKTWVPPTFDPRDFSCEWNNFVQAPDLPEQQAH